MSVVEAYAIAAPKAGSATDVNAIKAAEPAPELKGKTTAIKAVAIIEWLKYISKHQIAKGASLGEVVLKMSKLFDWIQTLCLISPVASSTSHYAHLAA